MRFLPTKTPEQQGCLMLHRARHSVHSSADGNHLAELEIVAPVGRTGIEQLLGVVADSQDKRLRDIARAPAKQLVRGTRDCN